MTDHTELKRLAEAAPSGPWIAENDSLYFKDDGYTRHLLDADAGHDVEDEDYYAALNFIAAANPAAVLALVAENELARMRIKEMDLLFGRYILAMRSALIEEEHGKGPAAGMEWIYNSLAGPGELPPEGETDSQAYFDREIVAVDNGMQEVLAFHDARRAAKEASQ
jgi:hypothetical protein